MANDKALDLSDADFDENNYKSCFARSVAVNSQYKHSRSLDPGQLQPHEKESVQDFKKSSAQPLPAAEPIEDVRLRKYSRNNMDDIRRLSCSSLGNSRRTSFCSSRIAEIPVGNIVHQSKVETLQWQLKEAEKGREMYKAVMKQVAVFLERTHLSLENLAKRENTKQTVPRSKSEHQIVTKEGIIANLKSNTDDFDTFRDFTWRRSKKPELSSDEIPPEKLSQEAYRLLRTVQSLLNTEEPKLSPVQSETDLDFLAQLAREFPQSPEVKPQRTTSFSLSPKLITPEAETRISTAFNRKLSLQLHETRRRTYKHGNNHLHESPRESVVENDSLLTPSSNEFINDKENNRISFTSVQSDKMKFKSDSDKSNSPPGGSISSVEDESGFSSMNSFQEIGLPLVGEEVSAKNALLRSMLHNNIDNAVLNLEHSVENDKLLWQKPDDNISHRRWSSTPVKYHNNGSNTSSKAAINVLWV